MASSISTGILSADTLIWTGRNRINAISVFTDGTNIASVRLYDNTSAANKVSVFNVCLGANQMNHIIFENPVLMENGIFADVTGIGATYIVYFGG